MIISRNQSRALAVAVLVGFFLISTLVIYFSRPSGAGKILLDLPSISIDEQNANVVLGKFHRSEMKNGKKAWEITAEKGKYITEKNQIVVYSATMILYRPDGTSVNTKADEATLTLAGSDISSASAKGHIVVVYNNEATVTADDAHFDKATNVVTIEGHVTLHSESFDTEGDGLTANLTEESLQLTRNVHSTIRKAKEKK